MVFAVSSSVLFCFVFLFGFFLLFFLRYCSPPELVPGDAQQTEAPDAPGAAHLREALGARKLWGSLRRRNCGEGLELPGSARHALEADVPALGAVSAVSSQNGYEVYAGVLALILYVRMHVCTYVQ